MNDIQRAQVEAGEAAVIERLRAKGLLPQADAPKGEVETVGLFSEATRALAEGHRRLDAAKVPPASNTVCDDPTCQSLIGHRIQTLVAERDALLSRNESLVRVLARVIDDLPSRRDWLDPALEIEAAKLLAEDSK